MSTKSSVFSALLMGFVVTTGACAVDASAENTLGESRENLQLLSADNASSAKAKPRIKVQKTIGLMESFNKSEPEHVEEEIEEIEVADPTSKILHVYVYSGTSSDKDYEVFEDRK